MRGVSPLFEVMQEVQCLTYFVQSYWLCPSLHFFSLDMAPCLTQGRSWSALMTSPPLAPALALPLRFVLTLWCGESMRPCPRALTGYVGPGSCPALNSPYTWRFNAESIKKCVSWQVCNVCCLGFPRGLLTLWLLCRGSLLWIHYKTAPQKVDCLTVIW